MKKFVFLMMILGIWSSHAFCAVASLPDGFASPTYQRDLATLNYSDLYPISRAAGSLGAEFFDVYKFTVADGSDLEFFLNSARFKQNGSIDEFNLTIYLYDEAKSVLHQSLSNSFALAGLGPATYFIGITGIAPAGSFFSYSADLSVMPSAVPVPAAAILLGAGLLGIVGIRRRQSV